MWIILRTPIYYETGDKKWYIIDDRDGEIYEFYYTREDAEDGLGALLIAEVS